MEQEIATLVLNALDISTDISAATYYNQIIDNQFGTISNNRCNLTWKNINLKIYWAYYMTDMKHLIYIYIK